MIEVGELRHRVRFDRMQPAADSHGDVQDAETGAIHREWVPVMTVWAAIKPISAREFRQSAADQNEFNCTITTRFLRLIADSTNMRAVHVVNGIDAVIYNIAGPMTDRESLQEYLTFPASAGVSDGE